MYYKVVFSAALLVLTGCSSVPPPAQTEETVAQTSDPSSSQPAKKEQLSAGKSVTITTSQGEINVAPAVVSVANAPAANPATAPQYNDPWELTTLPLCRGCSIPVCLFIRRHGD